MKNIDVFILCGGLGTRLRSVTGEAPKVMAEVGGKPFLDVVIEYLKQQGFQRVILCTGYQASVIEEYYRKNFFGLSIEFSREQEPLGTGGALKNVQTFIQSDLFFVLNGDSFCPVDFKNFLNFHKDKQTLATLSVSRVDESKKFGGVALDETNKITGFHEKEEGNNYPYVNAGVYCLSRNIFSLMPEEKKFSLEYDFFPKMVKENIYGFFVEKSFFDIGTPERLKKARKEI